jgi:hypothetical protein
MSKKRSGDPRPRIARPKNAVLAGMVLASASGLVLLLPGSAVRRQRVLRAVRHG